MPPGTAGAAATPAVAVAAELTGGIRDDFCFRAYVPWVARGQAAVAENVGGRSLGVIQAAFFCFHARGFHAPFAS